MSSDLAKKLELGLEELAIVREQLAPLIPLPDAGVIETAAACPMLHSFYTEIEKILKLIAREWDGQMPSSDACHKELLTKWPAQLPVAQPLCRLHSLRFLSEFLAFRHLFRGASIVLMRWEKLSPLLGKVGPTYDQTEAELRAFLRFLAATERD